MPGLFQRSCLSLVVAPFIAPVIALFTVLCIATAVPAAEPLANTKLLEMEGDLASTMVDGIDKFLLEEITATGDRRSKLWTRDITSAEKYNASVQPKRERLAKIIGAQDAREPISGLELVTTTSQPALVGQGEGFEVYVVRWPVLKGITGEGLLLKPTRESTWGDVICIPDADQTPEMLAGLAPGVAPEAQFARRLAESGCRVVIPCLIDRADTYSLAAAGARPTNQPHREFIYRQAYEMGRHIVGYEVQKVLALVDFFTAEAAGKETMIGLFGYAEGGLIGLHAAALDTRIDIACISGYFDNRDKVWQEPIYRNVFGYLHEFGDAELASLIAPRMLLVEAAGVPAVAGPPMPREGHSGAAPGALATPALASVQEELNRGRNLVAGMGRPDFGLVASGDGTGPFGSQAALARFLAFKYDPAGTPQVAAGGATPTVTGALPDPQVRLKRQLDQMTAYTQALLLESEYTRKDFWKNADRASQSTDNAEKLAKWVETTKAYRENFYNEVIGRFDQPLLDANPRTRKMDGYDNVPYQGYEVVLDVFPNVMAYGILLLPKDIKEGEKRPVVVCQHGLEGRPQDVAVPGKDIPAYHDFACKLAERGFITYSPQNPYIFEDRFRQINRKGNPIKKTLFSIIVPQHQQTVNWLAALPQVDPERIAFYGLSYGGKTAMRVPAIVEKYCLSICSADFNEWIWKNTSSRSPYSYLGTGEYEIFEFDLGMTYNYAEMAGLIAPRPFMVERGHRDGVAPPETVAFEYAKVQLLYADLKIPERTTMEVFDGPHTINGVGTYDFLHTHLKWPKPQ